MPTRCLHNGLRNVGALASGHSACEQGRGQSGGFCSSEPVLEDHDAGTKTLIIIVGAMVVACMALAVISSPAQATTPPADPGVRVAPQDQMAVGSNRTCAIDAGDVRCWGRGEHGQLGNGNTDNVGDNGHPADAGTVDIGGKAIAGTAGSSPTCALRADGRVLCWGSGALGYGNTENIGDDESPAAAGPVNIGRSVIAISAGELHTCALMNNGQVRCWGASNLGRLGYANNNVIGDDETPASVGGVPLF